MWISPGTLKGRFSTDSGVALVWRSGGRIAIDLNSFFESHHERYNQHHASHEGIWQGV
jgi:hypothetical protein